MRPRLASAWAAAVRSRREDAPVEDVLGGRTSHRRFESFLADWKGYLERRVATAVATFAAVTGVRGLLLAGGVGRCTPWPLSDIDLLPIYDDDRFEAARDEVERLRLRLLEPWIDEGWWTGLDIGRLAFRHGEVAQALELSGPAVTALLHDDRWYHALDKGYQGRAVYDPDNLAVPLSHWFTRHRFEPSVVRLRLRRTQREVLAADCDMQASVVDGDLLGATTELRSAVKWLQTWKLEDWGERDASLGRIGTRFERLAIAHGHAGLPETLNELSALDTGSVERRMAVAPGWVGERHDRSWRARRYVGEDLTRLQDARDTLRVCSLYAARRVTEPPYPAWLAIPTETQHLADQAARLATLIDQLSVDSP